MFHEKTSGYWDNMEGNIEKIETATQVRAALTSGLPFIRRQLSHTSYFPRKPSFFGPTEFCVACPGNGDLLPPSVHLLSLKFTNHYFPFPPSLFKKNHPLTVTAAAKLNDDKVALQTIGFTSHPWQMLCLSPSALTNLSPHWWEGTQGPTRQSQNYKVTFASLQLGLFKGSGILSLRKASATPVVLTWSGASGGSAKTPSPGTSPLVPVVKSPPYREGDNRWAQVLEPGCSNNGFCVPQGRPHVPQLRPNTANKWLFKIK